MRILLETTTQVVVFPTPRVPSKVFKPLKQAKIAIMAPNIDDLTSPLKKS